MRQTQERAGAVQEHQRQEANFVLAEHTFATTAAHAAASNDALRHEVQTVGAAEAILREDLRHEGSSYHALHTQEASRVGVLEQQIHQNSLEEQSTQRTIKQLR